MNILEVINLDDLKKVCEARETIKSVESKLNARHVNGQALGISKPKQSTAKVLMPLSVRKKISRGQRRAWKKRRTKVKELAEAA